MQIENKTNAVMQVDLVALLQNKMQKYIHFQDMGDAVIGPFASQAEIDAHIKFCQQRGDGAEVIGIYDRDSDEFKKLVADDVDFYTAAEDRAESFDENENDVLRDDLRDDGRCDGFGESYGERNS